MDEKLLRILGCPVDKERLDLVGNELICTHCGKSYKIKDGIPVILIKDYYVENNGFNNR